MAIGDKVLIGQNLYIEIIGGQACIGSIVRTTFAPNISSDVVKITIGNSGPVVIELGCGLIVPAVSLQVL